MKKKIDTWIYFGERDGRLMADALDVENFLRLNGATELYNDFKKKTRTINSRFKKEKKEMSSWTMAKTTAADSLIKKVQDAIPDLNLEPVKPKKKWWQF